MGKTLPGCPIVGYYRQDWEDYEEHSTKIEITHDDFKVVDLTKPYGFVDINAKVWFQKFLDDNNAEREYLVTEGYLWTEAFPEAQRIITKGNNQSMELSEKNLNGHWSTIDGSTNEFFIINEAFIEKLCILGENIEPCFEGAQIKQEFSYNDFKAKMFNMIQELQHTLNEGGLTYSMNDQLEQDEVVETVETESTENIKYKKEEKIDDDNMLQQESDNELENLTNQFNDLTNKYNELSTSFDSLQEELKDLRAFKNTKMREEKQKMIDSFYMLSEEEKSDVVNNIDNYSLDDIEAKLSVICVRSKIDFKQMDDTTEQVITGFSLNNTEYKDTPEWIKEVKRVSAQMN